MAKSKVKTIILAKPVSSDPKIKMEAGKIIAKSSVDIVVNDSGSIASENGEYGVQNMAAVILLLCVIVKIIMQNIGTAISIWNVIFHPIKFYSALKNIVKAVQDIAERSPDAWLEIKDFDVVHESDDLLKLLMDGLEKILSLNVDYK